MVFTVLLTAGGLEPIGTDKIGSVDLFLPYDTYTMREQSFLRTTELGQHHHTTPTPRQEAATSGRRHATTRKALPPTVLLLLTTFRPPAAAANFGVLEDFCERQSINATILLILKHTEYGNLLTKKGA